MTLSYSTYFVSNMGFGAVFVRNPPYLTNLKVVDLTALQSRNIFASKLKEIVKLKKFLRPIRLLDDASHLPIFFLKHFSRPGPLYSFRTKRKAKEVFLFQRGVIRVFFGDTKV